MKKNQICSLFLLALGMFFVISCSDKTEEKSSSNKMVGVVLNTGGENDKGFNEYTLKGAKDAALESGLSVTYIASKSDKDYEKNIETLINDGAGLIITVGFQMGEATAAVAETHAHTRFVIVDYAYFPGAGCPEKAGNCYSKEGGLQNVTSLMFAEDEIGYLAGVLSACMTKTNIIASISGVEIPPVIRLVNGFKQGAKSVKPDIAVKNQFIPSFDDFETGRETGLEFIAEGVDVIFGVGGNTGNGGLMAAFDKSIMAVGVDVDQYGTYHEVKSVLLTSAMKKTDVAAANAVRSYAAGNLKPGIAMFALVNKGVGLAPYHDWESKIPDECKEKVETAKKYLISEYK